MSVTAVAIVAGGYLAGSIPTGYWLVRLLRGEDLRSQGSGNMGGSNVWRTYGRGLGLPVVLFDVAKGFVPALVGTQVAGPFWGVLAGAAAMFGHWRPLFLGFKRGGKMVATCGGAFLGVAPLVALTVTVVWLVIFLLSRYASLASMLSAAMLPVAALLFSQRWPVIAFGVGAAAGVFLLHRANIGRLLHGTEHRFQLRRPAV
ncbi:MAG: acyl phosphate:glycerol-3-phosphate acyltransferase [Gaiellaceae bacterium]|nr:acyl phosphate:glycerol-3-phosphate acyltransferase [Gaiellaceae bacterium]